MLSVLNVVSAKLILRRLILMNFLSFKAIAALFKTLPTTIILIGTFVVKINVSCCYF